jgi:hypothetical protein
VLEELVRCFGNGKVRSKGPSSSVMTHGVSSALHGIIIPFFERNTLRVKEADFVAFSSIVRGMREKEHLSPVGFERIVRLAYGMNARGKQRSRSLSDVLAGSSETIRRAPQS